METPYYRGLFDAVKRIYAEEGMAAFGRGLQYRVMSHAPAVAISWTTYESIKRLLT
jgi:solute carrier family 25 iron transporter 28/37